MPVPGHVPWLTHSLPDPWTQCSSLTLAVPHLHGLIWLPWLDLVTGTGSALPALLKQTTPAARVAPIPVDQDLFLPLLLLNT